MAPFPATQVQAKSSWEHWPLRVFSEEGRGHQTLPLKKGDEDSSQFKDKVLEEMEEGVDGDP